MVKKNRISSDALLKKKSLQGVKKPNPFEIQTSKTKFSVLNRDTQTNRQTGLSGVQRARAIEKRKQTLGQEYLQKHKSNRFVDQRKDGRNMTGEQLLSERKSMASRRKEMYNLNDSVKLTHRGQTLEEIERFDDAVDNDDNDSDDAGGQLDADFMEAAHFGGGAGDNGKDRKTVIEEMIAESKRKKAEKQRENDEVYEMTQKLDQNWQSLISVVGGHMKGENERPKLDDYDKVMREMIFERRGKPADKLKSAEELAKIEKDKQERLERERLARMAGEENGVKAKHRSADDLDEGYFIQPVDENSEEPAADEDNTEEQSSYDPRNITKEAENGHENEDESESDSEADDSEESDESDESEKDNLSDLVEDSDEDEPETKETPVLKTTAEQAQLLLAQQKEREKAAAEVPLVFEIPKSYEELANLLNRYPPIKRAIVFERILSSNNGRATFNNKPRMISLFAFAIQYLNDCFTSNTLSSSVSEAFETLNGLTPFLYDLAKMNPRETATCFQDVIKEKQEEFRKRSRQYPSLDTLVFFKLVPLLFSASDFRHPVVSPAMVFLSEILSRCQVRDRKDITAGMFLVTVALECTEQSNRILPAALNFLNGVIYMCSETRAIQVVKIVPPFKSLAPWSNLLVVEEKFPEGTNDLSLRAEDFTTTTIDESYKLRVLNTALGMIRGACARLSNMEGIHHIVANFLPHLRRIDEELYPKVLQGVLAETRQALQSLHDRPLHYLVAPEKKPKPLRLLEPKIEATYEDIRRRPKNQTLSVREQRRKLQQKVKKETRAAAREIRQDNEFLAKMRMQQRVASDRDRREKVKRIFSEATAQQGELKSYDRKAKYKK